MRTNITCKLFFSFLFVLFSSFYFAQESGSEGSSDGDVIVVISGDAVLYSQDESFNQQVSKNKNLRQYSKIVDINGNKELKIIAKNSDSPSKTASPNKRSENTVLASQKKYKSYNYPQKKVEIHIKDTDGNNQFLANSCSGKASFVSPTNDISSLKYIINYNERLENASLIFSLQVNHLYKNSNSKLQTFSNDFSVRPPPGLI